MTKDQLEAQHLSGDFKLKGEFMAGSTYRESVISRCEVYAGWTIPSVFPVAEINDSTEQQGDYQSVGAQAVTNLSNKIMMALFQPSKPFFRINLSNEERNKVMGESGLTSAQVDAALAEAEREAMRELEAINARVVMNDVMQQLIITGNTVLYMPDDGDRKLQSYSLRDFAIKRDLRGNMIKLIIREVKQVLALPDELAATARAHGYNDKDEVSIYTGVCRYDDEKYVVWQELESVAYAHTNVGKYTKDTLPWLPLTWNLVRNNDYGSGLVETYAGDFHTLSTLAETILDFTTVVTDVKFLVNPAGMTDPKVLNQAKSGSYVHGLETDIFVLTANVTDATNFLTNQFESVSRRIGAGFLLNTLVTRQAERVTAEEIKMQAHELESSLGGVYSRLASELQIPLAKRLLKKLNKAFANVKPVIVTGLESLSRNSELDNLRAFFQDLISLADVPQQVSARIDYNNLIATLGAGHGVAFEKFLKDEKTAQADMAKAAQAQAQAAGMEAGAIESAKGNV
jgi:hypothetical protein